MNLHTSIVINGTIADIDKETAIGLNFQTFNPSKPENLFLSFTNTFSIPLTKKNRKIFDYSDHVGYNSTEIYDQYTASVYIGGYQLFHGRIYVSSIDERINISVYDKLDFVESLKQIPFAKTTAEITTIQGLLADYVNANNTFQDDANGTAFENIVKYLASGTNDMWLPYSLGGLAEHYITKSSTTRYTPAMVVGDDNLQSGKNISSGLQDEYGEKTYKYKVGSTTYTIKSFDDYENVCLGQFFNMRDALGIIDKTNPQPIDKRIGKGIKTGHLMGKVTTILDLVFDYLGVESNLSSLLTNEKLYVRMPDLAPIVDAYPDGNGGYYLKSWIQKVFKGGYTYDTIEDAECMEDVNAWDLIKVLMQEYNLVVDRSYNISTSKQVYTFHFFNDIMSADSEHFKLVGIDDKSFAIESLKQKSVIAYEGSGGEDDADTDTGLLVECANQNIEEGSTEEVFFKINRYLPSYYAVSQGNKVTSYLDIDLSETDNMDKIILLTPYTEQYAQARVWLLVENALNYGGAGTAYEYIGGVNGYKYTNSVVSGVPLLVAKQRAVKTNGAYTAYQEMVRYPLVYKVRVLADLANAIQHKSYLRCEIEGIVGDFYIASIENYNPATDKYFTMTIYRLQRQIADGEDVYYLLATETIGGAYVITETNENEKFITKE